MTTLKITKLQNLNLLVIKQSDGNFFITAKDSIIIDIEGVYKLLNNLLYTNMIDAEIVKEILDNNAK